MSTLRESVTDYLAVRRVMGFKAEGLGKLLLSFVTYCEVRGATHVRSDLAVQWATSTIKAPVNDAFVRPPDGRGADLRPVSARAGPGHRDPSRQDLQPALPAQGTERVQRGRDPRLADGLRHPVPAVQGGDLATLIGLLSATGMRPGEACRLSLSDLDLDNGVVQVLQTKFDKSRLVFLHPTTARILGQYLQVRQDWVGSTARACPAVFVNCRREALDPDRLGVTFRRIVAAAGIATASGHRPPRLHDVRHTFAVTTMLDWYRDGLDVQARLPLLSTWLGHVDPASTYWYLHAVPELLAHATDRLEAHAAASATESPS